MSASSVETAPLQPHLAELLLELSIGVHRFGMYPSGHPVVASLGDRLARRVNRYTSENGPLTIGVAGSQLLIGEGGSDPQQPILRDLARKARDKGIGALSLLPHLAAVDVEFLLDVLAKEPGPNDPIPPADSDRIRFFALGYDHLDLADGSAAGIDVKSRASDLWLGLARSAIASGAVEGEDAEDAAGLAERIRAKRREVGYDQVIMGYMAQLAGVLTEQGGSDETRAIKSHFTKFLHALDKETLRDILQNGGGNDANLRFAFDVCHSLDPNTAMKVLEAIPKSEGRRISHQLMRLLKKMAVKSDGTSELFQSQTKDAFRSAIERLSEEWDLEAPNPAEYDRILERMASQKAVRGVKTARDSLGVDRRIVHIALEVGSVGTPVTTAIDRLVEGEGVRFLLKIAESAPREDMVGAHIRSIVDSPDLLSRLFKADEPDEEALDAVVERLGLAAIDPLMEALSTSPSRSVRRAVFDRLKKMGMPSGLAAVTRLENQPWYVLRNLLVLAQALDEVPQAVDVLPYMFHEDSRVRREALPVCMKMPGSRVAALQAALRDKEPRLAHMALVELRADLPGPLVGDVRNHVQAGGELSTLAVRALGGSSAPLALKALLDLCLTKRFFGGVKLSRKSDRLLEALEVLRTRWHSVEEARSVLKMAARSKDAAIRSAAGGR